MHYLDYARLDALPTAVFADAKPFPWINPAGLLSEQGYRVLLDNLPDVTQFKRVFGVKRSHGQQPHDHFALEYRGDLPIPPCWHHFVAELRGARYDSFVRRMFRRGSFQLSFH